MGLPGGILLGLILGGWLHEAIGWRYSFLVCGLPGAVLAAVVGFRLREPPHGYSNAAKPATSSEGAAEREGVPLLSEQPAAERPARKQSLLRCLLTLLRCRTYVCVLLGGACNLFAAIGLFVWLPAFCERKFGTSTGITGSALSGTMLFGALCTLAGGAACDAIYRRSRALGVYAALPAASVLLGFPFACALCFAPSFGLTIALFLPPTLAANFPSGPLRCLISELVPVSTRAMANSVLEIGVGLAGGLGPLVAGSISDAQQRRRCPSALARRGASQQPLTEAELRCSAGALSTALLAIQFASVPAAALLYAASRFAEADLRAAGHASVQPALEDAPTPRAGEDAVVERPPDAAVSAEAARVNAAIMATFALRKAEREAAAAAAGVHGSPTPAGRAHRIAAVEDSKLGANAASGGGDQ